jgi:hypothetical protein
VQVKLIRLAIKKVFILKERSVELTLFAAEDNHESCLDPARNDFKHNGFHQSQERHVDPLGLKQDFEEPSPRCIERCFVYRGRKEEDHADQQVDVRDNES